MSIKLAQVKWTYFIYVHNMYNNIHQYPKKHCSKNCNYAHDKKYVNIFLLVYFICLKFPSKVIFTVAK